MQNTQKKDQKSAFASMSTIQALPARGTLLSERAFSIVMGAALTWGFILNAVIVWLFGASITRAVMTSPNASVLLIIGLIGYFILALVGNRMVLSQDPIASIVGFHLVSVPIGLLLCLSIPMIADPMGFAIIFRAAAITAVITLTMMIAATIRPALFARMGTGLLVSLFGALIGSLLCSLLFPGLMSMWVYIIVGIMALYIGFDWVRAHSCAPTFSNAIAAATALYLDIINIFIRVLSILARSRRD